MDYYLYTYLWVPTQAALLRANVGLWCCKAREQAINAVPETIIRPEFTAFALDTTAVPLLPLSHGLSICKTSAEVRI